MSAAPRFLLIAAAGAASLPAPAFASPFTDGVETAVFSLCPQLRDGRISANNPDELTRLGYFRTPEIEDDWADAEDGSPYVFTRGRGADAVTIAYWPAGSFCDVRFGGRQGAAAAARVQARLAREPRLYRPVRDARYDLGDVRHEAWQVARRSRACLAIDSSVEDAMTRYDVSYEPLPLLHPGTSRSACEAAGAM